MQLEYHRVLFNVSISTMPGVHVPVESFEFTTTIENSTNDSR